MNTRKLLLAMGCYGVLTNAWSEEGIQKSASMVRVDAGARAVDMYAAAQARVGAGDELLWLGEPAQSRLLVARAAVGHNVADALLLVGGGDSGLNHADVARRYLVDFGWHTYWLRGEWVPGELAHSDEDLNADVQRALTLVRERHTGRIVLLTQAQVAQRLLPNIASLGVTGVVLLNLAEPKQLPAQSRAVLESLTVPTLLLQEFPKRWRGGRALGPSVEIHLLPQVSKTASDNLIGRTYRGWVKRQLSVQTSALADR